VNVGGSIVVGRRLLVGVGLAIAVLAAFGLIVTSLGRPADRRETGVVVAVSAASLTAIRSFTIRTSDGRTIEFVVGELENGAQFPPGHLGEHMATAAPIVVTYRDMNGEHVAVRLEDAPAPS
jgi:hypothetical protein